MQCDMMATHLLQPFLIPFFNLTMPIQLPPPFLNPYDLFLTAACIFESHHTCFRPSPTFLTPFNHHTCFPSNPYDLFLTAACIFEPHHTHFQHHQPFQLLTTCIQLPPYIFNTHDSHVNTQMSTLSLSCLYIVYSIDIYNIYNTYIVFFAVNVTGLNKILNPWVLRSEILCFSQDIILWGDGLQL